MEHFHRRRGEARASWSSRQRARDRNRRRPGLEGLESRALLTTIVDNIPLAADSTPQGIAAGPDGQVWFSQTTADEVGMVNPATGQLGTPIAVGADPEGIVSVPGGNIWFAEAGANAIGEIRPGNGGGTFAGDFATPTAGSQPYSLAYDSNTQDIYFTEVATNKIGWFAPATIQSGSDIHEVSLPTSLFGSSSSPQQIVYDQNDGLLWFTANGSDQIGSYNPSTQAFASYKLPSSSMVYPGGLAIGSDGNVWFLADSPSTSNGVIGMLDTSSGQVSGPYTLPSSSGNSKFGFNGITAGPDGNLWVTASGIGQIAWFSPSDPQGLQWMNTPNTASRPDAIADGPDGNIWFTEESGATGNGSIGVAVPDTHVAITQAPAGVTAGTGFGIDAQVAYTDGSVDTGYSGNLTVALASDPGGGGLGGTLTLPANQGAASFTGLVLNNAGTGYSLTVSASQPTFGNAPAAATTAPFDVTSSQSGGGSSGGGSSGGGSSGGGSSGGGSPTSTSAATPTIVAEQITAAYLKHNKKGKPIGKPVEEIVLTFSAPMNAGIIGNAGSYQVSWASTKKVNKHLETILHPVAVVSATVDPTDTVVTLLTNAQKTKFARGGQISIVSPGSMLSAAGAPLGTPTTFTISPRGGSITPA